MVLPGRVLKQSYRAPQLSNASEGQVLHVWMYPLSPLSVDILDIFFSWIQYILTITLDGRNSAPVDELLVPVFRYEVSFQVVLEPS